MQANGNQETILLKKNSISYRVYSKDGGKG